MVSKKNVYLWFLLTIKPNINIYQYNIKPAMNIYIKILIYLMLHAKLPVLGYACKQVTRYAFQLWDMHAGYEIYICMLHSQLKKKPPLSAVSI